MSGAYFLCREILVSIACVGYGGIKMENKRLPLNLQFFADDSNDDTDIQDNQDNKDDNSDEKVELTNEELQKKIEAESDRKLNSALEKKQKEWEQQQEQAIQKALEEKERLSKLSEKERKQEEMTKKEKELADREAEINRRILRSDAVDALQEKELPSDFADFLLADNAENTLNNINEFKKAFDNAVNAAVKEKLRQDTPKTGSGTMKGNAPSVAQLAQENRIIK